MTSEETPLSELSELRIALVGKVGAGKTSVMNTFLRSSEKPASRGTEPCQVQIGGRAVVLVDTPGLCSTEQTDEEVMEEIKRRVSLAAPGPHVFLIVLSCLDRFTEEEQEMVKMIQETFGEHIPRYSMVLFTRGDQLKKNGKPIEKFIDESNALRSFVNECKGGHHVFDNRDQDPSQVTELLQKISVLVRTNGGKCFTESEDKRARLKKRIAVSTGSSALTGAAVGGVVSHFVGGSVGVALGATAGGVIGGIAGGAGILAVEHSKHAEKCMIQ